jgi:hypothetical protein
MQPLESPPTFRPPSGARNFLNTLWEELLTNEPREVLVDSRFLIFSFADHWKLACAIVDRVERRSSICLSQETAHRLTVVAVYEFLRNIDSESLFARIPMASSAPRPRYTFARKAIVIKMTRQVLVGEGRTVFSSSRDTIRQAISTADQEGEYARS